MLRLRHLSSAAALLARLLYYAALAAAVRTRLAYLEEPAAADDYALASARLAHDSLRAVRRACAVALRTFGREVEVDGPFAAENRLVEFDVEAERHVLAPSRRIRIGALALPSAAEEGREASAAAHSAAEKRIKDVAEIDVLEMREVAPEIEAARAEVHALVPELVVALALFGIGKHLVRLGNLGELLLCLWIVGVAVGMVLHRELAVGGLYLVRRRSLRDAKHLIVVSLLSHT